MKQLASLVLALGLAVPTIALFSGCESGVEDARKDVIEEKKDVHEAAQEGNKEINEAHQDKAENVADEQKDVNEAQNELNKEEAEEGVPATPPATTP